MAALHAVLQRPNNRQAQKIDERRRRYILAFVSYITSAVMFIYGFKNLYSEQVLLPVILFGTGLAFLLNILWFHLSRNLQRACVIEAVLVGGFVLSLVYQGGFNNTALYWVFPFPAILFGLLGVRIALLSNALLVLMLCIMLFIPDLILAQYKDAEASRFIASLLIVIIVCWINDHYRERSHQAMDLLQQSKEMQANTDALTELANRRFIDASLLPSLALQPAQFFPLSLIMCDIDHFKQLNDRFGHDAGDDVLKAVAQLFRKCLRQHDFACRTGGEEFLLILPHTNSADAFLVAEKIRSQLAQQALLANQPEYHITASFGVALCDNAEDFTQAVKHADEQMYLSKRNGRNQVN
ncbi:GGDEF domain-containing protein [Rheinheimera maricola]|uniref:diguanylate cyclase n=1 Tax=Rheinheimera maricola TaxID=2793282 RepID=A0ABS7XE10_9GAMM|nr:GGDEF domain-containing protein [Rheinheimera maricola]MBZ9613290.1 GGDEF domain-containing protein [Rheinheimera maricola]